VGERQEQAVDGREHRHEHGHSVLVGSPGHRSAEHRREQQVRVIGADRSELGLVEHRSADVSRGGGKESRGRLPDARHEQHHVDGAHREHRGEHPAARDQPHQRRTQGQASERCEHAV
jgi:hypothetical protein